MTGIDITTPEGRAELRELAAKATPGPWHWDDHRVPTLYGRGGELGVYAWEEEVIEASHSGECGCRAACTLELEVAPSDAEFIAAARTAVPALLDALDTACSRMVADENTIEVLRAQVLAYQQTYERDLPRNGGTSGIVGLIHRAEAAEKALDTAEAALDRVRALAAQWDTLPCVCGYRIPNGNDDSSQCLACTALTLRAVMDGAQ